MSIVAEALIDLPELNVSFTYHAFIKRLKLIGFDQFEVVRGPMHNGPDSLIVERWAFIGKPTILEFRRLRPGDPCDELAVSRACKIVGLSSSSKFWSAIAFVPRFKDLAHSKGDPFSVIGSGYHDIICQTLSLMESYDTQTFSTSQVLNGLDLDSTHGGQIDAILGKLHRKELIHRVTPGQYAYGPMSADDSRFGRQFSPALSSLTHTQADLINKLKSIGFTHRKIEVGHWGLPGSLLIAPNGYTSIFLEARDLDRGANHIEIEEAKSLLGITYKESLWDATSASSDLNFRSHRVVKRHMPSEFNYQAGSIARLLEGNPGRIFTRNEIEVLADIPNPDITKAIQMLSRSGRVTYIKAAKLAYTASMDAGVAAPVRNPESVTLSIRFDEQPVMNMIDRVSEVVNPINILSEHFPNWERATGSLDSAKVIQDWIKATEAMIQTLNATISNG